jgi:hypothetical protein
MKKAAQMSRRVGMLHHRKLGLNTIATAHVCLFKIVAGMLAGHADVFTILEGCLV